MCINLWSDDAITCSGSDSSYYLCLFRGKTFGTIRMENPNVGTGGPKHGYLYNKLIDAKVFLCSIMLCPPKFAFRHVYYAHMTLQVFPSSPCNFFCQKIIH